MSSWIISLDALTKLSSRGTNTKESLNSQKQEMQYNNNLDLNPIHFLTTGIFFYYHLRTYDTKKPTRLIFRIRKY